MKFSLATVSTLGILASGVSGIDLNPDDKSSIKKASSILAADMRKWYTGDKPGDVPGNLPSPYYWWEAGAMFNAFIDYWDYTKDDQYNNITMQAMLHQVGQYNAFMPRNQTKTLGNDDQAFWGMAAMAAAEAKFPDPPSDQPSWLSLAQGVFNTQVPRWDVKHCAGGLKWQIYSFNKGYDYKNTISNGCFFNIAARLARYTGNATYTEWAEKVWDWEKRIGLMGDDYHFYDGSDDETWNCTRVNHIQWTYNAGVHMSGAAALYNATGSDVWKQRLDGIVKGIDVFFTGPEKNIMYEVACENNGKCNLDQRSFKAYLARWMGYTMKVAPHTIKTIMPKIRASAVAATKQCNGGDSGTICGLRWTQNGVKDDFYGVGEQMAALEVTQSLLIDETAGPVSENSGGTSKSDPSAGTEEQVPPKSFDDITAGDKAGAGILTTIVILAIVGGAWWMVS